MDEQTFLQDPSAVVTSSRVVINGQTFATRNVGSVQIQAVQPSRLLATFLFCFVGLSLALAKNWLMAAIFFGAGGYWFWSRKVKYRLMMMAGGGEVAAIESTDGERVRRLHDAVAQAISVR